MDSKHAEVGPISTGEMAGRIRAFDWSATPLGSSEGWSPVLYATVNLLLAHAFPMVLLWGPELIQIYNDGYRQILGNRHPHGLGQPTFECWPETFDVAGPIVERARAGETISFRDAPFRLNRTGDAEDAWFTVTYSPVMDDAGAPAGVLITVFETTDNVLADRALRENEERQSFLLKLSDALRPLSDPVAVQETAMGVVGAAMKVSRAFYGDAEDDQDILVIGPGYSHGTFPLEGQVRFSDFELDMAAWYRAGRTYVIEDAQRDTRFGETAKVGFAAIEVAAAVGVPLVKDGRVRAIVSLHQSEPRRWTAAEVALLEETAERTWAAVERARAEERVRRSEERQAFLLRLNDALRPLSDPVAAQGIATQMLGAELRVDRCYYAEFDWPRDVLYIHQEYVGSASFSVVGEHPISAFQDLLVHSHRGEPLVCDNIATHPIFSREVTAYRERGTDGFILIPMVKQGVMVACMCVTMAVPRAWSAAEIDLVREVGDRTWEASQRIRAEGATRESEERFLQFANASSGALWVRDAATLRMEYVSPAIATVYGIEPGVFLNGVRAWASAILPDDRDVALEHLERARRGEAVTHEFRILRPSDGAFRWIRDTDFPLRDAEGRVQRIGGIAEDVTEAKLAAEHGRVLLLELQHRVRNIMAMIRSVADQTGDTVDDAEEYRDRLDGRLSAMARVQTLLTREANAGVDLATLVEAELSAQAGHAGQYAIDGPRLQLAPKAAEVLTLAVHELATNALKYGAFSHPAGRLAVAWSTVYDGDQPWLHLDWTESGAAAPLSAPRLEGFGTALIRERIPYELNGRGSLAVEADGLRCRLEFPLRGGASILETDTVVLSTAISGGSLDMAGEADLTGCTILVVEDDYYLARDTARALRKAGGAVIGPVGSEADALALIASEAPRCALVDINLGEGARFVVADALRDKGVPFTFVTGYDDVVIPARFDDVERLRKPIEFRQAVRAAAQMCAA